IPGLAPGTYSVTATDAHNCVASGTFTVTEPLPVNVYAGPDKILTCSPPTVTLSGSSSSAGAQYSWSTLNGHIQSGATSASPVVDAIGTYVLTVTDNGGCFARDTVVVTANNSLPDAHAGPDKSLNCAVTSITLSGSSSSTGVNYHWAAL